jgi:nucleoside-diphosphate-sugar epimerase
MEGNRVLRDSCTLSFVLFFAVYFQTLYSRAFLVSHAFIYSQAFDIVGVALRPGVIHGNRKWGSTSIPLGLIFRPLETALSVLPAKSLVEIPLAGAAFVPPVSVLKVAKAAVSAATDPSVPPGIMDVWTIQSL